MNIIQKLLFIEISYFCCVLSQIYYKPGCNSHQYLSENSQCINCNDTCLYCFSVSTIDSQTDKTKQSNSYNEELFCLKCKDGFFYDYQSQKCVDKCEQGKRTNPLSKICEICEIQNCSSCSKNIAICENCQQQYDLLDNQCQPNQEQLVKNERLFFNYYETNECGYVDYEDPSKSNDKDCFQEVQSCPVLQNQFSYNEEFQLFLFDNDYNAIYIFTYNKIYAYSFPKFVQLQEESVFNFGYIQSCGLIQDNNEYIYCITSYKKIIKINKKSLVSEEYQKFDNFHVDSDYDEKQVQWKEKKIIIPLSGEKGLVVFDLEKKQFYPFYIQGLIEFFFVDGEIIYQINDTKQGLIKLYLLNYNVSKERDILLIEIDATNYLVFQIMTLGEDIYFIFGYDFIYTCKWNLKNIQKQTNYQKNSLMNSYFRTQKSIQKLWDGKSKIIISFSSSLKSLIVSKVIEKDKVNDKDKDKNKDKDKDEQLDKDYSLDIIFDDEAFNVMGYYQSGFSLVLMLKNGFINYYELDSNMKINLIEQSYSIGIYGFKHKGMEFVDGFKLCQDKLDQQKDINCQNYIFILTFQEIILINLNEQNDIQIKNKSKNIGQLNNQEQISQNGFFYHLKQFLSKDVFKIEKQIGFVNIAYLELAQKEFILKSKNMHLIILKSQIRSFSLTDNKQDIMQIRINQNCDFLIDVFLFQKNNILFLIYEQCFLIFDVDQFSINQINETYLENRITHIKKITFRNDNYFITVFNEQYESVYSFIFEHKGKQIQIMNKIFYDHFIDIYQNENELIIIYEVAPRESYNYQYLFMDFSNKYLLYDNIGVKGKKILKSQIISELDSIFYILNSTESESSIFQVYYKNNKNRTLEQKYTLTDKLIEFSSKNNTLVVYIQFQDYIIVKTQDNQDKFQTFACEGKKKFINKENQNHNFDFIQTNQQSICVLTQNNTIFSLQKIELRMNILDLVFFYLKKGQEIEGNIVEEDIDVVVIICQAGTYLFEFINGLYKQYFFSNFRCDKVKYANGRELICIIFNTDSYKLPLKQALLGNGIPFGQTYNDIIHLPFDDLLIFKTDEKIIVKWINTLINTKLFEYDNILNNTNIINKNIFKNIHNGNQYNSQDNQTLDKYFQNLKTVDPYNGFFYDQLNYTIIVAQKDAIKQIVKLNSSDYSTQEKLQLDSKFTSSVLLETIQEEQTILLFDEQFGKIYFYNYHTNFTQTLNIIANKNINNSPGKFQIEEKIIIKSNSQHIYALINNILFQYNYKDDLYQTYTIKDHQKEQIQLFVRSDDKQVILIYSKIILLDTSDFSISEKINMNIQDTLKIFFSENLATFIISPVSQNILKIYQFCTNKNNQLWQTSNYEYTVIGLNYNLYSIFVDFKAQKISLITTNCILQVISLYQILTKCNNQNQNQAFQNDQQTQKNETKNIQKDINIDKEQKQNFVYQADYFEIIFNLTELLEDIVNNPPRDDEKILRSDKILMNTIFPMDVAIIAFSSNIYVYSIYNMRCLFIGRTGIDKLKKIMIVDYSLIMTYNEEFFFFLNLDEIIKYNYLSNTIQTNVINKSFIFYSQNETNFAYYNLDSNTIYLVDSSIGKVVKSLQIKSDIKFNSYYFNSQYTRSQYQNHQVKSDQIYNDPLNCSQQYLIISQSNRLLILNLKLEIEFNIYYKYVFSKLIACYNNNVYFITTMSGLVRVDLQQSKVIHIDTLQNPYLILNNINLQFSKENSLIIILKPKEMILLVYNMKKIDILQQKNIELDNQIFKNILYHLQIDYDKYALVNDYNQLIYINIQTDESGQNVYQIIDVELKEIKKINSFYYDYLYKRFIVLSFNNAALNILPFDKFSAADLKVEYVIPLPSHQNNKLFITQDQQYYIVYSEWLVDIYLAKDFKQRIKIRQVYGTSIIKQVDMIGHYVCMIVTETEILILVIHLKNHFLQYKLPLSKPQVLFTDWKYLEKNQKKLIELTLHVLCDLGYSYIKFLVNPSVIDSYIFESNIYNYHKQEQKCVLKFDLQYSAENNQIIKNLVQSINLFSLRSSVTYSLTDLKMIVPSQDKNKISEITQQKTEKQINYETIFITSQDLDNGKLLVNNKTEFGKLLASQIRTSNITYVFVNNNQDPKKNIKRMNHENKQISLTNQMFSNYQERNSQQSSYLEFYQNENLSSQHPLQISNDEQSSSKQSNRNTQMNTYKQFSSQTFDGEMMLVSNKTVLSFYKIQFIGEIKSFRILYSNITSLLFVNNGTFKDFYIKDTRDFNHNLKYFFYQDLDFRKNPISIYQSKQVELHNITLNNVYSQSDSIFLIKIQAVDKVIINNLIISNITSSNTKLFLQVFEFIDIPELFIKNIKIENITLESFQFAIIQNVGILRVSNITISNIILTHSKQNKQNCLIFMIQGVFYSEFNQITIEQTKNVLFLNAEQYISENNNIIRGNQQFHIKNFNASNCYLKYKDESKEFKDENNDQFYYLLNIQSKYLNLQRIKIKNSTHLNIIIQADICNIKNFNFINNNQINHSKIMDPSKQSEKIINNYNYSCIQIKSNELSIDALNAFNNIDQYFDIQAKQITYISGFIGKNNTFSERQPKGLLNIQDTVSFQLLRSSIQNNNQYNDMSPIISIIDSAKVDITLSNITNNTLYNSYVGVIKISNSLIKSNQTADITYCNFFNNSSPQGSGGALYIEEINLNLRNSKFKENKAMIGGAIRIKSYTISPDHYFEYDSQNEFENNQAELFGQNIGYFPQKIQYVDFNTQELTDQITIKEFRSGDIIPNLYLILKDNEENIINLKNRNSTMSKQVHEELESYLNFELQYNDQKNIVIKNLSPLSQNYSNILQLQVQVVKKPGSQIKLQIQSQFETQFVRYNVTSDQKETTIFKQKLELPLLLEVRQCQIGEIYSKLNEIYICESCPIGKYSIVEPDLRELEHHNITQCKICPAEAVNCSKSTINLKNGFWWENNISDRIYPCNKYSKSCMAEDINSREVCTEGYIGPLCQSCDTQGRLWGDIYAKSSTGVCSKCSQEANRIVMFVFFVLLSLGYFIFIVRQNQICSIKKIQVLFLKRMNILNIGKSAQFERSTVLSKIFMSHTQVQVIIVTSSQQLQIPQSIQLVQVSGDPIINIFYSLDCLLARYSLQIVFLRIAWILFYIFCILIFTNMLFIYQYLENKSNSREMKHYTPYFFMAIKIIIIYFFPGLLTQLIRLLTCVGYGSKLYSLADLQFECQIPEFSAYLKSIAIPLIVIISLFPIYFILKQRKTYKLMGIQLNAIKSYGFLFYGYRLKAYYWEQVKLIFKAILIILITIYHELYLTKFLLILIVLIIYMQLQSKIKPYETYEFNYLDFQSHLACSLTLISILINITTKVEWQIYLSFAIIITSNSFFLMKLIIHYFQGYKIPYNHQNRNIFDKILFILRKYFKFFFGWIQIQKKHSFKIFLMWHKLSQHLQYMKADKKTKDYIDFQEKNMEKIISQDEYNDQKNQIMYPGYINSISSIQVLNDDKTGNKFIPSRNQLSFVEQKKISKTIEDEHEFKEMQRMATEGVAKFNNFSNIFSNEDNFDQIKSFQKYHSEIDSQNDMQSPTKLIFNQKNNNGKMSFLYQKSNVSDNNINTNQYQIQSKTSIQGSYIQSQIQYNRQKNIQFSQKPPYLKGQQKDSLISSGQESSKMIQSHSIINNKYSKNNDSFSHRNAVNDSEQFQNNFKVSQFPDETQTLELQNQSSRYLNNIFMSQKEINQSQRKIKKKVNINSNVELQKIPSIYENINHSDNDDKDSKKAKENINNKQGSVVDLHNILLQSDLEISQSLDQGNQINNIKHNIPINSTQMLSIQSLNDQNLIQK